MESKVGNALKWSFLAEMAAKLILPISNMILARLLAPEMFGVVATITMVTSFADIFTDAGFQKYLIQHNFENEEERNLSANVAFWTNMTLAMFIWVLIVILREKIATLVGNEGLGKVIAVASVTIPITAFASLQSALLKREFNFKKLFSVRIIGAMIPLVVTVPLAAILKDYRAMVIGTIVKTLVDAVVLTVGPGWKPQLSYDFSVLKKMFSFGIWNLLETILLWLNSYIGTFIIGFFFSQYYLGLYKTAMTTVNHIISLITASTTTVLFSALSRVQDDKEAFNETFLKFQRMSGILIIPMGVGMLLYKELVTDVMLGDQWKVIAEFVGIWGGVGSVSIIWANYPGVAYIAKGKTKLSMIVQIVQLAILLPTLYISSQYGFRALYISRTLVRVVFIFVNFAICRFFADISPTKMVRNVVPHLISSGVMTIVAFLLKSISGNIIWQFCSIALCAGIYFVSILSFAKIRKEVFEIDAVNKLFTKAKGIYKGLKFKFFDK